MEGGELPEQLDETSFAEAVGYRCMEGESWVVFGQCAYPGSLRLQLAFLSCMVGFLN